MSLEKSLDTIGKTLGPTVEEILNDGLPEGSNPEWKYDEELINDIAAAIEKWVSRLDDLEEPWVVSYFNSETWQTVSKKMTQPEAYKIWYQRTRCGKENCNPSFDCYFYMGPAKEVLNGRHPIEEDEDDFSLRYLLNKSFGE